MTEIHSAETCPTCGQAYRRRNDREARIQSWLDYCAAEGLHVLPDNRVAEAVAAQLLGIGCAYLEKLRRQGDGPRATRLGLQGSRWSYALDGLADWIDQRTYRGGDL